MVRRWNFLLGFFSGVNSLLVSGKTVKPINPLNLWMFRLVTTQTPTSIQLIRPSFFSRHKSLSLLMMRWRNTAAGADGPHPCHVVFPVRFFLCWKNPKLEISNSIIKLCSQKKLHFFGCWIKKRNGINGRTMQNWPAILSPWWLAAVVELYIWHRVQVINRHFGTDFCWQKLKYQAWDSLHVPGSINSLYSGWLSHPQIDNPW